MWRCRARWQAPHTGSKSRQLRPFVEHAYIEPEAGYAQREGNRLVVYGCTQAAQMDRESLADILGLDLDAIRVMPSAWWRWVRVKAGRLVSALCGLGGVEIRGDRHAFATVVADR